MNEGVNSPAARRVLFLVLLMCHCFARVCTCLSASAAARSIRIPSAATCASISQLSAGRRRKCSPRQQAAGSQAAGSSRIAAACAEVFPRRQALWLSVYRMLHGGGRMVDEFVFGFLLARGTSISSLLAIPNPFPIITLAKNNNTPNKTLCRARAGHPAPCVRK